MSFWKAQAGQEEAVQLDPGTQALMSGQRQRAGENLEQIANQSMAGAKESGQALLPTSQGIDQGASALAMAQPENLSKILSERGQKYFNEDTARQRSSAKEDAISRQTERFKQAISPLEQQHQMKMQQYEIAMQNEKRKKAARASTIGSILGIAGAAGGAYLGGGTGAKAGLAAGQSTGEAVAG